MIDLTKGERAELATRSKDYTLPTERLYERKSSCWRARGLATIASQPPRHAAPGRQQVALALLYPAACWS